MSGHKIFFLFLTMCVVIFTAYYFEDFSKIEYILSFIFGWFIVGVLVIAAILPAFGKGKDNDN